MKTEEPENQVTLYDRWGGSFNLQTEFVVVNQARAPATAAWLMAQTPLKNQPWKSSRATIEFTTVGPSQVATLKTSLDSSRARIVWEAGPRTAFRRPNVSDECGLMD